MIKNYSISSIVLFLCLNGASTSFAHDKVSHAMLGSLAGETKLTFVDGDQKILSAVWTATVIDAESKPSSIKYKLQLKRDLGSSDSAKPISLYNLRLQGRLWAVTISSPPSGVAFTDGNGTAIEAVNNIVTIPRAASGLAVEDEKVCFITFKSGVESCELTVQSNRPINGKLNKSSHEGFKAFRASKSFREGHHTQPPPPTPGGEEGDSEP